MSNEERNQERMDVMEEKLDKLLDSMNGASPRGRRRREEEDDDRPRSAKDVGSRRGRDPLEIQGVLFQVRVPVGRHGDTMSGYLLFPPVRDERELEELADDVERDFRLVKVWSPKDHSQGGNGFRGNNYGDRSYRNNGDRGYRNFNDRDRGYNGGYGRRW